LSTHRIYQPEAAVTVQQLHHSIIEQRLSYSSILEELENYSLNLLRHYKVENPAVTIEISNHHPELIAESPTVIFDSEMDLEDFQFTVAKAYGFEDWVAVEALSTTKHDPAFEMAINILLSGHIQVLSDHLRQYPQVINQRSAYGHRAGLIHYLGSNGIEIWRQIVPSNLEELLRVLVKAGADPDMTANLYGKTNLLALLTTSDHAWKAKVAKPTIERLQTRVF
jgi:hypothetical protein